MASIPRLSPRRTRRRPRIGRRPRPLRPRGRAGEHAIECYHDAFENGALDPARFKERLSALDARLDALQAQDQSLAREMSADTHTAPDTAALEAVADELGRVVATGNTDQAKALLRILIADVRVNSRAEILPIYRVAAPTVCAHNSSVEPTDLKSNHSARLAGGRMSLDEAD